MTIPFDPATMDAPIFQEPPVEAPEPPIDRPDQIIPDTIIKLAPEKLNFVKDQLMKMLVDLRSEHGELEQFYTDIEDAYRAMPIADQGFPFKGHATETIPIMASTIGPIHARLDIGINKQDPPLRVRALRSDKTKYAKALERWVNHRRKNQLRLRTLSTPAYLELCKLGTCVAKTVYAIEETKIKQYVTQPDGMKKPEMVTKTTRKPKVTYPSCSDVMWPAGYTDVRALPIIAERQFWTADELLAASDGENPTFDKEVARKVITYAVTNRTAVQTKRDEVNRQRSVNGNRIELTEAWFWFDPEQDPMDTDGTREPPSHLVATIHENSGEILQLRYNYYFHQQHPYTITPYTVVNGTLRGMGAGEMSKSFQSAITRWYRMANDNAYLSNIRMFAMTSGKNKEKRMELYAGRVLTFADPMKDIREIKLSDTYPSTMSERNYLDQINQRLTGSNDYMSGGESPVVGSRATATSTLALIAEGKSRVEEVLENIRNGEADIALKCLSFDIQFGPGDDVDKVLDPEDADLLKEFCDSTNVDDLEGAIAIELTATDAGGNRNVQQQNLMAVQQIVDGYCQQIVQFIQMGHQDPTVIPVLLDCADAKRDLLRNLLTKYDIPDPDNLLPDLNEYLQPPAPAMPGLAGVGAAGSGDNSGPPPGIGGPGGIPGAMAQGQGAMAGDTFPHTGVGGIDRTAQRVEGALGGA